MERIQSEEPVHTFFLKAMTYLPHPEPENQPIDMYLLVNQYIAARQNCLDLELKQKSELEKAICKVEKLEKRLTGEGVPVATIRKPSNPFSSYASLGGSANRTATGVQLQQARLGAMSQDAHERDETAIIVATLKKLSKTGELKAYFGLDQDGKKTWTTKPREPSIIPTSCPIVTQSTSEIKCPVCDGSFTLDQSRGKDWQLICHGYARVIFDAERCVFTVDFDYDHASEKVGGPEVEAWIRKEKLWHPPIVNRRTFHKESSSESLPPVEEGLAKKVHQERRPKTASEDTAHIPQQQSKDQELGHPEGLLRGQPRLGLRSEILQREPDSEALLVASQTLGPLRYHDLTIENLESRRKRVRELAFEYMLVRDGIEPSAPQKSLDNSKPASEFRSASPLAKTRCPICNEDIVLESDKDGDWQSICHGRVRAVSVPDTILHTLDFDTSHLGAC